MRILLLFVLVLVVACALPACTLGSQTATRDPAAFVESDNKTIQTTIDALNQHGSFTMVVETRSAGPGNTWEVDYANMNQPERQWLASGRFTDHRSDMYAVFDAGYRSTCLQLLRPSEGPWVYHSYVGWRTAHHSTYVFTPPVPLIGLRVEPPYKWSLVSDVGDELVLSAEIASPTGKLKTVLYIDPDTHLVTREERHGGGTEIVSEFSRYGKDTVPGGVHKTKSGCKGRNE